eukprot:1139889-Pelagomonas_calceolata.AAC.4
MYLGACKHMIILLPGQEIPWCNKSQQIAAQHTHLPHSPSRSWNVRGAGHAAFGGCPGSPAGGTENGGAHSRSRTRHALAPGHTSSTPVPLRQLIIRKPPPSLSPLTASSLRLPYLSKTTHLFKRSMNAFERITKALSGIGQKKRKATEGPDGDGAADVGGSATTTGACLSWRMFVKETIISTCACWAGSSLGAVSHELSCIKWTKLKPARLPAHRPPCQQEAHPSPHCVPSMGPEGHAEQAGDLPSSYLVQQA